MAHTPHELADEFPEHRDRIHALKTSNPHFAKLADQYHAVNRQIHRAETGIEPVSEGFESQLRRQRLALKDEIAEMLRA